LTNGTLNQSSKTLKTIGVQIVTGLPRLYQQCTNGVPIVKNSQKQSKDSQNSKNDHWCTNRHHVYQDRTNSVPIVKNSRKTVKTAKMTIGVTGLPRLYQQCTSRQKQSKQHKNDIGVPVVTCLPRLYQQCNNRLPIVNKNLAIANRSRVSCAHNTSRVFIGLNIIP